MIFEEQAKKQNLRKIDDAESRISVSNNWYQKLLRFEKKIYENAWKSMDDSIWLQFYCCGAGAICQK